MKNDSVLYGLWNYGALSGFTFGDTGAKDRKRVAV